MAKPAGPSPRLVFVESNTTGSGMLALRQAAALGFDPVLVTNNPGRYRGLAETECPVLVRDTNSLDALRGVLRTDIGLERIGGLLTTSEFYLVTVAELASALGLPGNPPGAMRVCRNKAETRRRLEAAGLPGPRFAVVRGGEGRPAEDTEPPGEGQPVVSDPAETWRAAALGAVDTVGLPCVVKPADDTGSFDVRYCDTAAGALDQIRRILATTTNVRGQDTARTALVEEFIAAPEFSVEAFSWRGETTVVGITEKTLTGFPHFVEWRHIFPADLPAGDAARIEDTVRRALGATGFAWGASHTEAKLTAGGPVVVEINARLAGGMIPDLVKAALGVDLLEQQIRVAVGWRPELAPIRSRRAGIQFLASTETGDFAGVEGIEEVRALPGIAAVMVTGRLGQRVAPPRSAYDRLGYVIVSGRNRDEVAASLDEAGRRLKVIVEEGKP